MVGKTPKEIYERGTRAERREASFQGVPGPGSRSTPSAILGAILLALLLAIFLIAMGGQ